MSEEKRFAVRTTFQSKPTKGWMTDGDQDGDRWEGSALDANKHAERLRKQNSEGWTFEVTQVAGPKGCNKHEDCAKANAEAVAAGHTEPYHCNAEDCEECFGS